MAETLDLSLFVEPGDAGASHMTLAVEGVSCAGCIRKIESGLNKLPGVIDARLNFSAGSPSTGATTRPTPPRSSRRSRRSVITRIRSRRNAPTPMKARRPSG
jgi:copper chaperone CopZ